MEPPDNPFPQIPGPRCQIHDRDLRQRPVDLDGEKKGDWYCPTCHNDTLKNRSLEELQKRAATAREAFFDTICPDIYRETKFALLPKVFQDVVDSYVVSAKGYVFKGKSGQCKTRTAYLLLRLAHDQGHTAMAVYDTQLMDAFGDQFRDGSIADEANSIIRRAQTAKVLVIDDLGKGRRTERGIAEMGQLFEIRTSRKLQTIVTTQYGESWILSAYSKFSDEDGAAIVRRMFSFAKLIDLNPQ